jgi:hypothetical protein
MLTRQSQRRLNGLVGVFLLVAAVAGLALFRTDFRSRPLLTAQVALLGLAGVCDLVAAVGRSSVFRWYQWSGLGNVLLGVSLPLGFTGFASPMYVGLTLVGGFSLAAFGLDMLLFHGEYTRSERLDTDPN